MSILLALIVGIIIGGIAGGKLAWKHAFRELGKAELRNRMSNARSARRWHSS